MIQLVWMLAIGLAVGLAARILRPSRDLGGVFITLTLGVAGSIVAGVISRALGWYQGEWSGLGFVISLGGAMLLLLLYRLMGGDSLRRMSDEDK